MGATLSEGLEDLGQEETYLKPIPFPRFNHINTNSQPITLAHPKIKQISAVPGDVLYVLYENDSIVKYDTERWGWGN